MLENLKITPESKEGIEWLKQAYSYRTYSIAIDNVVLFFKRNKINPTDDISENYSQVMFDLKKELIDNFKEVIKNNDKNSDRIIRIVKNIENLSIKPNVKITAENNTILKTEFSKNRNKEIINQSINLDINENLQDENLTKILELENIILEQDKLIKSKDLIAENLDLKIKEYHKCLKKLNENVGFVDGLTGKKVYIKLPFEEVEKLFYLIP